MQSHAEKLASVTFLLVKGPRTAQELISLTGISRRTIWDYLAALRGEGLVVANGTRKTLGREGRVPTLWFWVAEP